jgi:hypothetical protein
MKRGWAVLMLMLLVAIPASASGPGKEQFVAPGNSLEVISRGEHKGRLIAEQHKYFLGGGTYDWFWVLEPDGREAGPIGEDVSSFRELYLSDKPTPR